MVVQWLDKDWIVICRIKVWLKMLIDTWYSTSHCTVLACKTVMVGEDSEVRKRKANFTTTERDMLCRATEDHIKVMRS